MRRSIAVHSYPTATTTSTRMRAMTFIAPMAWSRSDGLPAPGTVRGVQERLGTGDGYAAEEIADERATLDTAHASGRVDDDSMRQGRFGEGLDIVRDHVLAALHGRPGAARVEECQRSARAGAEKDVVVTPCHFDESHDVLADRHRDVDGFHGLLPGDEVFDGYHLTEAVERMPQVLAIQHLEFSGSAGIAEGEPQEEPVELGFRKRKGPLVVDRVFRREHEKGTWKVVRHAVDGDLGFLHRFEQRGL